jgi:hypothetical protein
MKRWTMLLTASVLTLAACDEKKPEAKPDDPAAKNAPAATTTAAAGSAAAPAAVTINDTDLATPADFEEAAEKAITKANYKAELTTLEADIAKD